MHLTIVRWFKLIFFLAWPTSQCLFWDKRQGCQTDNEFSKGGHIEKVWQSGATITPPWVYEWKYLALGIFGGIITPPQ